MRFVAAGAALLLTGACAGDGRTAAQLFDYSLVTPSTLNVMVDGCRVDPAVEDLQETSTEVRLLVMRDQPSGFGQSNCADVVVVELAEPLGTRALINARSGVEVQSSLG